MNKKVVRHLLLLIVLLSPISIKVEALQKSYSVKRVVIDAGHGGHDSGCLGGSSKEKEIALAISLELGKMIQESFPEVKVIYTRKTDVFVELNERAKIANDSKADLFICIHCNSACYRDAKKKKDVCNPDIEGTETWVMGLHKTEANLEVAKRENDVVLLEKDFNKKYDGYDPNSPEANILFSLFQNTYLDQSLQFATLVQDQVKAIGRKGRGVKQAGFLVLYKTYMPGVLIETGFLSNKSDEKLLLSDKGQQQMAKVIFNAFKKYKAGKEAGAIDIKDIEENKVDIKEEPKVEVKPAPNTPIEKVEEKIGDGIFFTIQFLNSPTAVKAGSSKFKGISDYNEDKINGAFKYMTGRYKTFAEALRNQKNIRAKGFDDAFVVAYRDGKRMNTVEARKLTE